MIKIKDPYRDSQQKKPVCHCDSCGGEIYNGEPYVIEDGSQMCVDCYERRVNEILRESPAIVAECMGMMYERGQTG